MDFITAFIVIVMLLAFGVPLAFVVHVARRQRREQLRELPPPAGPAVR